MSRKSKGPHLWLRKQRVNKLGRMTHPESWIIIDRNRQISTGYAEDQRVDAESLLLKYIQDHPSPKDKTTYIYFITADQPDFPVKIGKSETCKMRFSSLQVSLPYNIQVLAMIATRDPAFELRIHRQFRTSRVRGEWFKRTPELLVYIDHLKQISLANNKSVDSNHNFGAP